MTTARMFTEAYDEGFDSGYRGNHARTENPFRPGQPGADADFALAWDGGWTDGAKERATEHREEQP